MVGGIIASYYLDMKTQWQVDEIGAVRPGSVSAHAKANITIDFNFIVSEKFRWKILEIEKVAEVFIGDKFQELRCLNMSLHQQITSSTTAGLWTGSNFAGRRNSGGSGELRRVNSSGVRSGQKAQARYRRQPGIQTIRCVELLFYYAFPLSLNVRTCSARQSMFKRL